jgi:RimJ/RimL family protein N-acetyltransferase
MTELHVGEHRRVLPLIERSEAQGRRTAVVYAVIEGRCPGRVLADDPAEPRTAIVDARPGLHIFGDPDLVALQALVPELLAGRLPANGRPVWSETEAWRGEGKTLWATSAAWREVLQSLFSVRRSRWLFELDPASWSPAPDWQKRLPPHLILRSIHDAPIGWEGQDVDPEESFGFVVCHGDREVSRCWCEFMGRREAEITISTDGEFQRRGLAFLTCTTFIGECLANGLRPVWSCESSNTASARLAEKLGFTRSPDLIGYFLHPSFQALDGRWGPPLIPEIRGYDEAAIGQEAQAILTGALDAAVSAFTLLPGRQEVSVWHHFGGIPQQVASLPVAMQGPLLARFKEMTEMNIHEQGWPQYGRCGLTYRDTDVVLRMTYLPSTYGDELLVHLSGRPPLKRIPVRTTAGEELWIHCADEQPP